MKATAHTAKIATRAGIGRKAERELTDADRAAATERKAQQEARLARIAARRS